MAASDAIKVAGSINGRRVEMVVDTGAERTFLREGILPDSGVRCGGEQLCGVTGDCVPVKGPVWVNLAVGRVIERLPVFVAEMEDECLLGLDYLNRVGACVDLRESRMLVRGCEVPLYPNGELTRRGVVEKPGRQKPQYAKCHGLGHVRQGRVAHMSTDMASHLVPPNVSTNGQEEDGIEITKEKRQRDCQEDLPEYLEDLVGRSTTQLTTEQADRVKVLLTQYQDVFSSGNLDLGRTSYFGTTLHLHTRQSSHQAGTSSSSTSKEERNGEVDPGDGGSGSDRAFGQPLVLASSPGDEEGRKPEVLCGLSGVERCHCP